MVSFMDVLIILNVNIQKIFNYKPYILITTRYTTSEQIN